MQIHLLLPKPARDLQAEDRATEQLPPPSEEHLNDGVEDAEENAARQQGTDIEQGQSQVRLPVSLWVKRS